MKVNSITYKFETFEALQRALEVLKAKEVDYQAETLNQKKELI